MNLRSQKGFTIVEMAVVISIIAFMSTVVIANFPKARSGFALSQAAYKFAQDVRRAQDLTLSSTQYRDMSGTLQAISGYGLYVSTASNKSYILYADKYSGNEQYGLGVDYVLETIDFSQATPGIVIKEINGIIGSDISINFSPPNPKTTLTNLSGGGTSVDIVFAIETDLNTTKTVTINNAGLVEVR